MCANNDDGESESSGNRLLTIAEAAERLSISYRETHRMIQKGEFPVIRFGPKLVRVDPDDLDDYISGKRAKF